MSIDILWCNARKLELSWTSGYHNFFAPSPLDRCFPNIIKLMIKLKYTSQISNSKVLKQLNDGLEHVQF